MPNATAIKVIDNATPALQEMKRRYLPAQLAAKAGPAMQRLVEEHLAALGGNQRGWPSTGFYEKFARNVRWVPVGEGVVILILPAVVNGRTVGLNQRRYGGPISPVTAKALAIPISPVSYGHVPSDFPGLFLLKCSKGTYLVQSGEAVSEKTGRTVKRAKAGGNAARRQRASLNFLFILIPGVFQEADPSVLPTDEQITATALTALTA